MSTPILYIALPAFFAFLLFFLRKQPKLSIVLSMALYALLSVLAFFQEFGEVIKIGSISINLDSTLVILGREFVLTNDNRYFLFITCLSSLIWIGGLRPAGLTVNVLPYQLLVVASLTSALAVNPFVYSAIFVEIAVLCSMPLLIHAKAPLSKGVLRFLIFQSLSMPLILLGGWLVAGSQASPSDVQQIGIAGFLLGTGFAFWLAVFPFHSWIPQLSEDTHPYITGLLLMLFPQVALLVILDFTSSITWIRESNIFSSIFLVVGLIMFIAAAFWSIFEKNVKRIFGYLVLFETGSLLLLIGLQSNLASQAFFLSLIPRFIALLLASLCLSIITSENSSRNDLAGSFRKFPVASSGIVISFFSIIGLPPIGEFPFKLILLNSLGSSEAINPLWAIIGFIGIVLPIFGLISRFFLAGESGIQIQESLTQIIMVSIGILLLLLIGIFPGELQLMFSHLIQYLPLIG